jgi:hypothetical protein
VGRSSELHMLEEEWHQGRRGWNFPLDYNRLETDTDDDNSPERRLYYNADVGRPSFERQQLGESRVRPRGDLGDVKQPVNSSST